MLSYPMLNADAQVSRVLEVLTISQTEKQQIVTGNQEQRFQGDFSPRRGQLNNKQNIAPAVLLEKSINIRANICYIFSSSLKAVLPSEAASGGLQQNHSLDTSIPRCSVGAADACRISCICSISASSSVQHRAVLLHQLSSSITE